MSVKEYGWKFSSWDHTDPWNIVNGWPCLITWEKRINFWKKKKIKINGNKWKENIEIKGENEGREICQSLKRGGLYAIIKNCKEETKCYFFFFWKGAELYRKIYWITILQHKKCTGWG